MDKVTVTLEGKEYEVFFNIPRLCKLEKITGKRVDELLTVDPKLTDIMIVLSVGIGLEDIVELDRLPPDFNDILETVMGRLTYAMGADLKPKKSKPGKKSK